MYLILSERQVEAGHGHYAVLTVEKELYTWTVRI